MQCGTPRRQWRTIKTCSRCGRTPSNSPTKTRNRIGINGAVMLPSEVCAAFLFAWYTSRRLPLPNFKLPNFNHYINSHYIPVVDWVIPVRNLVLSSHESLIHVLCSPGPSMIICEPRAHVRLCSCTICHGLSGCPDDYGCYYRGEILTGRHL